MNCQFELKDNFWICKICGRRVKNYGSTPAAACRPLPPLPARVRHYAAAVVNYAVGGFQSRTEAEVERLLAICRACDRFNERRQSCSLCGCRCHSGGGALTNKLKMATERCPINRWK